MHDYLKMQGAFSWSELLSRDLVGSIRFYTDLLGWELVKMPMGGEPYYLVRVNGEDIAGMMNMPAGVPLDVPTNWGTYITVFDIDTVTAAVVPLGGTVLVPPQEIPGVGKFSTICDPDGGTFSLISYTEGPTGGMPPAVYTHGSITWSGLQSQDPLASHAFLSSLLNVDLEEYMLGGRTFFVIQPEDESGGTTGDLAEPYQPKSAGAVSAPVWMEPDADSFWLNCVQVNDVDQLVNKVVRLGGGIILPPTDIPDTGRYCTIRDPQGGVISLITYLY